MCAQTSRDNTSRDVCADHIVNSKTTKDKYSKFSRASEGKSSIMIFEKHANMRYKYGNRKLWCRGYYVDTVGKNEEAIKKYIANQLNQDKEYEQISMKEFIDRLRVSQ